MARINRSELTRLEIIRNAVRSFLEKGYSNTSVKMVCKELNMSPGNLTFHFPTKDHLLAALVELLCKFQWQLMEEEAQEGLSSVMAVCLELATMAAASEQNEIARDFFLSAYTSRLCLDIIRKNDTQRSMKVFRDYCPTWSREQFAEAEVLVSGIEYATLMPCGTDVPLDTRVAGALSTILTIYQVPEEIRKAKIQRMLTMDYRSIGRRVLKEFKEYVEDANEQALLALLKG